MIAIRIRVLNEGTSGLEVGLEEGAIGRCGCRGGGGGVVQSAPQTLYSTPYARIFSFGSEFDILTTLFQLSRVKTNK